MQQKNCLRDIMTGSPAVVSDTTSITKAAQLMRDRNVGGLIVSDRHGKLCGFITDRDIAIRGVTSAEKSASELSVGEICSRSLISMAPEASFDEAIATMKSASIRRLAVVRDGSPVGIVTIGDLAKVREPHSALANICAAPPQK